MTDDSVLALLSTLGVNQTLTGVRALRQPVTDCPAPKFLRPREWKQRTLHLWEKKGWIVEAPDAVILQRAFGDRMPHREHISDRQIQQIVSIVKELRQK